MGDNQAIGIPRTVDAIRATAGTVRSANESIAWTNTALGIETALV
jgi:hypothetical protein